MGSFLSKPITDKESTDESNDRLICGASSMQGWRLTQEDAHNCILDYDANTSFFAVYDGHGGHEVAEYCSQKLPDFIKNMPEYKEDKIEDALTLGFLQFDALIATPEVVEVLSKMARDKEEAEESDEEENVSNLYEEAAMPIEQVIEKYTSKSPFLVAKKDNEAVVGTSSASCSSVTTPDEEKCGDGVSSTSETHTSEKNGEEEKVEANGPESSSENETKKDNEAPIQNGEISTPSGKSDVTSSSTPVENGTPSKKGKGKAVIKPEPVKTPLNTRPKRNAQKLYKDWLDLAGDESDDSDEEDQTFEGPNEESSEDEGEGVNVSIDVSEEESSEVEGDEDDDEEDVEDEEDDDDDDEDDATFARNMKEYAGSESGCTAVVALLKGNKLYVANAGDSRCIVCRNGKAIEMSIDHKPEDSPEIQRILKAGGEVTNDGRVNGGLNLSRAIGDHAYKRNKELSDREQMITALPDIKTLMIDPNEDEFMVLACDGIWNSMSSQEVVDFVRPRMAEDREKLSTICEEIFDNCLASRIVFDGTGCDNMTAVIVKFKSNNKRPVSPHSEESDTKRAKTEVEVDTTV